MNSLRACSVLAFVAFLAPACGPAETTPPPAPPPLPPQKAMAPIAPPSTAPPAASSAPAPAPVDDSTAIARLICGDEPATIKEDGKSVNACKKCPAGSEFDILKDIPVAPLYFGDFTGAGNEALVSLKGCAGLRAKGMTTLLRKTNGAWQKVFATQEALGTKCEPYRLQRDALVCEWGDTQMGQTLAGINLVSVAEKSIDVVPVVTLTSNDGALCPKGSTRVHVDIRKWELADVNGDNQKDLVIHASGSKALTTKQVADCSLVQLPKPSDYKLNFLFDGKTFKPDAAALKSVKLLVD